VLCRRPSIAEHRLAGEELADQRADHGRAEIGLGLVATLPNAVEDVVADLATEDSAFGIEIIHGTPPRPAKTV
jgi:hypothetical protein